LLTADTLATIFIDALDECDPNWQDELLDALQIKINRNESLLKVFISSRDDGDIVLRLTGSPNIYIQSKDNQSDIERFVHAKVRKAIAQKRLLNGEIPDELTDEIIKVLCEGA
jgi:hypothetical protein